MFQWVGEMQKLTAKYQTGSLNLSLGNLLWAISVVSSRWPGPAQLGSQSPCLRQHGRWSCPSCPARHPSATSWRLHFSWLSYTGMPMTDATLECRSSAAACCTALGPVPACESLSCGWASLPRHKEFVLSPTLLSPTQLPLHLWGGNSWATITGWCQIRGVCYSGRALRCDCCPGTNHSHQPSSRHLSQGPAGARQSLAQLVQNWHQQVPCDLFLWNELKSSGARHRSGW